MLVLITHVKRGITLSNNQPAISLVKKAFSANGTEHERNADFDTLIALSPTCLFKTRCFPFQYLSICRDCSVLTMSTGFTAVSWLISVNARELESDSLPSKYKEFVSVVWCLTIRENKNTRCDVTYDDADINVFPPCPPVDLNMCPRTVYIHMNAVIMFCDWDPDTGCNVEVKFFALLGESSSWCLFQYKLPETVTTTPQ